MDPTSLGIAALWTVAALIRLLLGDGRIALLCAAVAGAFIGLALSA